jgi:phosphoribosylanthranilate isomerase
VAVEAKICGLTRPADAALAVELGASRLGVVFAGGPRLVNEALAASIVAVAGGVPVIGVYQRHDAEAILRVSAATGLRGAQLDGEYTAADGNRLRAAGLEVWRVVHLHEMDGEPAMLQAEAMGADVLLLEPRHPDRVAGARAALDLVQARLVRLSAPGSRVVLAGGLTAESVADAIRVVGSDGVDVSSGVESAPGIKDPVKMARFLEQVRDAYPSA